MASNLTDPSTAEDDDYQVENEDEEDDERTIEEEEQLNSEDEQNELNDLQADANMPLEELLKMYGQNGPLHSNSAQDDEDEEEEEEEYEDEDEETHSSSDVDDRPIPFQQLLHPNGPSLAGEEDDDSDDSSFELEAIKVIRVGDEYQAHVEANVESDSTNEPNDDREVPVDELFWSSSSASDIDNAKIDQYLKSIHEEYPSSDDEISLQTLLKCQFDPVQALLEFRQLPVKTIYAYREWSSDEIQRFEEGLREYRKDFFQISVHKCPDRNVREIVHFYYQWKKSERYEAFLEEQQRLNAITSVTDMIEKFIENQEQQLCTAVGVIPPTNSSSSSTSFLSNEFKRQSANPSISLMALHQQETMKRSLDQVDHESEPSAKKTALNPSNSSTSTTIV